MFLYNSIFWSMSNCDRNEAQVREITDFYANSDVCKHKITDIANSHFTKVETSTSH